MNPSGRTPDDVDLTRPSAARVYDYYLGGSHNLAVDRELARRAIEQWPELPQIMQVNRAFLRRVVRYLVEKGITQFLDLGSGIPTVGSVHEVARAVSAAARVVYVDIDPVAIAVGRQALAGDWRTEVVHADLGDVDAVLAAPGTTRLLDLSEPVGVLMAAVLHFVPTEADPRGIIARYRDAIPPGSHLAISHASDQGQPSRAGKHAELYQQTGTPMTMRSRAEILSLFDGFELADPGLVYMSEWRPEEGVGSLGPAERFPAFAGVGRR